MYREIYRLYARPSFFEGMARLFDFGGSLNQYNYSKSPNEADLRAMEADWQMVGEDLRNALKEYAVINHLEDLHE